MPCHCSPPPDGQVESYDGFGRDTKVLNGNSDLTTTTYTPGYTAGTTAALPRTTAVTDPLGYTTTTTYDQGRRLPVQVSDVNSEVTTETYDQLGRLLTVTLPPDQGLAATYEYSYSLTGTAPPAVTTQTLTESGYATSVTIYDGMMQEVQTRSTPTGNQAGSVDTWQEYNSDGWVTESDPAYWDQGNSPSTTLEVPDTGILTDRMLTAYDGQGRVISTATDSGTTVVAQTTTAYPGMNEADVTPPSGGTATTTVTNALGLTTQSWSYDGAARPDGSTADADITSYTYTPDGQVATIADNAGNTWQYGYDLLGDKTSATDPGTAGTYGPDSNQGQTSYTYDADGNLKTVTDPLGNTLTYTYDGLDRKIEQTSTPKGSATATKIASWTYDTAPLSGTSGSSSLARGQLEESDSYAGGADYKETITGYNSAYDPTGQTTTIPATGGAPAETFTTSAKYSTLTSELESTTYGNDGGTYGLPKETVGYAYNPLGLLTGFGSSSDYLDTTAYDATGQIESSTFGASGSQLLQQYTYDQTYQTRLDYSFTSLQPDSGPQDMWSWTYNAAGDVTSSLDQYYAGTTTATDDLQCYAYDDLQELTTAWTDSGLQDPTPPSVSADGGGTGTLTPGNIGGCADTAPSVSDIAGIAPYWNGYSYDPLGSRTSQTGHDVSSSGADTPADETTQSQSYPGGDGTTAAAQPAAATAVTTTSPAGTVTVTPQYDADGDTTSRAVSTTGTVTSGESQSLCLAEAGSAAGSKIEISTCSAGSAGQQWTTAPLTSTAGSGSSYLTVNGNCADVSGSGTASGTGIELESCSSSTKGEIWDAGPNGTWANPNSGMCLTDPGGSTTTGTQVTITACAAGSGNKDQSWATAAGTAASPPPGSTQGISYYPTGLVDQVTQSSGTKTHTITYIYDANGNLLVEEDPAAITYYGDGGAEELTFTTAGAISSATRFYSQSPDGTIIVRAVTGITATGSTGNVYYEVTDPQHTAIEAINASTLAVSRRSYDPYGNQLASASTWPDNKAYLDEVTDAPTALDLLGARQYNPVTGAFLSLDPILESGSPQQMGGYTYAANNPASTSDPSGLSQYAGGGTAPNPCGADASASCNPNGTGGVNGGDETTSGGSTGDSGNPGAAPTPTPDPEANAPATPGPVVVGGGTPGWDRALDWIGNQLNQFGSTVWGCIYSSNLADCEQLLSGAAAAVAAVVTDGASGLIITSEEEAASAAGEEAAAAENAAEGDSDLAAAGCGGESFTAASRVLLASAATIPISQLKAGDEVLVTNTKTGKTTHDPVTAVMVKRDTDRYNLTIRADGRTAVVGTTRNHLFWDVTTNKWTKAGALHHGARLRTPTGGIATVLGGSVPGQSSGWMWDLTVRGDHDFYIQVGTTGVLVHNCPTGGPSNWLSGAKAQAARNAANMAAGNAARDDIAAMYPGSRTEVPFETDLGTRIVDVLTPEDLAIESKVGYASLNSAIRSQIAKDQLLMQNGQVSGVEWVFSPNAYGDVGPSGPLAEALEEAGISWETRGP